MQALYSTYPTQETYAIVDHADAAAPTRQHELGHTDHTGKESIYLAARKYLDHQVRVSDLSVRRVNIFNPAIALPRTVHAAVFSSHH